MKLLIIVHPTNSGYCSPLTTEPWIKVTEIMLVIVS